jgi:hypothetical protein
MNLSIPRRFDDPSEDRLLRAADVQAQLGMSRAKVYMGARSRPERQEQDLSSVPF